MAICYVIGALIFQPIASLIQIAMLVYLGMQQEWKYFIYGSILFICSLILGSVVYEQGLSQHTELRMAFLAVSVFANLFWFTATIKRLKIKSLNESYSE